MVDYIIEEEQLSFDEEKADAASYCGNSYTAGSKQTTTKIDMENIKAGDTVIFVDEISSDRTLTDVIACFKHPDISGDRCNVLHKFCYILFLQGQDCYCPFFLSREGKSETGCEYVEEHLKND